MFDFKKRNAHCKLLDPVSDLLLPGVEESRQRPSNRLWLHDSGAELAAGTQASSHSMWMLGPFLEAKCLLVLSLLLLLIIMTFFTLQPSLNCSVTAMHCAEKMHLLTAQPEILIS